MNIVGYTLHGQDNDTYMFDDDSLLEKCPLCGYRLDFFAFNPKYQMRRRTKRDLSATYDGQNIVSGRFKMLCQESKIEGVSFRSFDKEPNYYQLVVERTIPFDVERRKTRFDKLCSKCGNFKSVVGASPAYLKISGVLDFGIYRTDVLFASGNEKHPLVVISPKIKRIFEDAKLSGLEFSPVYGIDELEASP